MKSSLLIFLMGCLDLTQPLPTGVDAGIDSTPDASVPPCCMLLPDESAARSCVAEQINMGLCGVLVCPLPDGTHKILHFCGTKP